MQLLSFLYKYDLYDSFRFALTWHVTFWFQIWTRTDDNDETQPLEPSPEPIDLMAIKEPEIDFIEEESEITDFERNWEE